MSQINATTAAAQNTATIEDAYELVRHVLDVAIHNNISMRTVMRLAGLAAERMEINMPRAGIAHTYIHMMLEGQDAAIEILWELDQHNLLRRASRDAATVREFLGIAA